MQDLINAKTKFIRALPAVLTSQPRIALFMVNGELRYELRFNIEYDEYDVKMHELVHTASTQYLQIRVSKSMEKRMHNILLDRIPNNIDEVSLLLEDGTTQIFQQ